MSEHLAWATVEQAMDQLEEGDRGGVVGVFQRFEGHGLDSFDMRGVRQTVNLSTFSMHFGFNRKTFVSWVRSYAREAV